MTENIEQRICIKFCFKLGKTGTETYEMMKTAFADEAMSRARVFEWFRRFKEGRESADSDPRSGRPSTSRNENMIARVNALVRSDRRLTVREIAEECEISTAENDRSCGRPVAGCFIMTEPQRTPAMLCSNSWQNTEPFKYHILLIRRTCHLQISSCFPR